MVRGFGGASDGCTGDLIDHGETRISCYGHSQAIIPGDWHGVDWPPHPKRPAMHRKKLPIGIQTFRKIREDEYYYVDKTALALRLIEEGSHLRDRSRCFADCMFMTAGIGRRSIR